MKTWHWIAIIGGGAAAAALFMGAKGKNGDSTEGDSTEGDSTEARVPMTLGEILNSPQNAPRDTLSQYSTPVATGGVPSEHRSPAPETSTPKSPIGRGRAGSRKRTPQPSGANSDTALGFVALENATGAQADNLKLMWPGFKALAKWYQEHGKPLIIDPGEEGKRLFYSAAVGGEYGEDHGDAGTYISDTTALSSGHALRVHPHMLKKSTVDLTGRRGGGGLVGWEPPANNDAAMFTYINTDGAWYIWHAGIEKYIPVPISLLNVVTIPGGGSSAIDQQFRDLEAEYPSFMSYGQSSRVLHGLRVQRADRSAAPSYAAAPSTEDRKLIAKMFPALTDANRAAGK